jgi:hypothetical protein
MTRAHRRPQLRHFISESVAILWRDWVSTLKPGDQLLEERVQRFLLGLGQR